MSTQLVASHLNNLSKLAKVQLAHLTKLFGVQVDIFAPVIEKGIYGTDDADITYGSTPIISQKFLLTSAYLKRFISDETLDPFTGDEYKLFYDRDLTIPQDAKCVIHLGPTDVLIMRATEPYAHYGDKTPIIKIMVLAPIQ